MLAVQQVVYFIQNLALAWRNQTWNLSFQTQCSSRSHQDFDIQITLIPLEKPRMGSPLPMDRRNQSLCGWHTCQWLQLYAPLYGNPLKMNSTQLRPYCHPISHDQLGSTADSTHVNMRVSYVAHHIIMGLVQRRKFHRFVSTALAKRLQHPGSSRLQGVKATRPLDLVQLVHLRSEAPAVRPNHIIANTLPHNDI